MIRLLIGMIRHQTETVVGAFQNAYAMDSGE